MSDGFLYLKVNASEIAKNVVQSEMLVKFSMKELNEMIEAFKAELVSRTAHG